MLLGLTIFVSIVLKSYLHGAMTVQRNPQSKMKNSRKSLYHVVVFWYLLYNFFQFIVFLMIFIVIHNNNTPPSLTKLSSWVDGKLKYQLEWPYNELISYHTC